MNMNFSPEQIAFAQEQMKKMSPEQLRQMQEMAQNMMRNGQMPPGMAGMPNPYAQQPQQPPAAS